MVTGSAVNRMTSGPVAIPGLQERWVRLHRVGQAGLAAFRAGAAVTGVVLAWMPLAGLAGRAGLPATPEWLLAGTVLMFQGIDFLLPGVGRGCVR